MSDAATAPSLVLADSMWAVTEGWRAGFPKDARILTFSPGLAARTDINVAPADAAMTPERIEVLEAATIRLSHAFYDLFKQEELGYAIIAARACFSWLHTPLYRAAALPENAFSNPIGVVRLRDDDVAIEQAFGSWVGDILADARGLRLIDLPRERAPSLPEARPPSPPFRQRFAFATANALLYRTAIEFWRRISYSGPRGTVFVLRENELVKETAAALALRGYAIRTLKQPATAATAAANRDQVAEKIAETMRRELQGVASPPAVMAATRIFAKILATRFRQFDRQREAWRDRLRVLGALKPRAVLTNVLGSPGAVALFRALDEIGVPLITFQHGVTMEINARQARYDAIFENVSGHGSVVFNVEAERILKANRLGKGPVFAAGMPQDYSQGRKFRRLPDAPPVWYVATALYMGNQGMLFEGVSDHDKCAYERRVVTDVLAKLPHRVLYKSYPGVRYLDPDPVMTAIGQSPNIDLYAERIDLRYIVGSSRILVTSRSFSTPSWCVMSGKPVVFIDVPHQAPLKPELRSVFAEGLFLFDAGAPDFHEKLRAFLSRPLDEIERDYAKKAAARAALIDRYFFTGQAGAGARAGSFVQQMMVRH